MLALRMFLLLLAVSAPLSGAVGHHCQGKLGAVTAESTSAYDPFWPRDHHRVYRLTIKNTGIKDCGFKVVLIGEQPLKLGRILTVELTDMEGVSLGRGDKRELRTPVIPAGATAKVSFIGVLPRGQFAPSGQYEAQMVAILTSAAGPADVAASDRVLDQAIIRLICPVEGVVTLALGGAGVQGAIEFGVLRSGDRRSISLNVFSNEPYGITLVSENSGVLRRKHGSDPHGIPYTLFVDGVAVRLDEGSASFPPVGRVEEAVHRLTVEIGQVQGAPAGDYRDDVNVIVAIRP